MKSGFKDPIKIKSQKPADKPVDGNKTPWGFQCPQYDERSSCFVNAGTHYGVGHKQPEGKYSASDMTKVIPYGKVNTMRVDEAG